MPVDRAVAAVLVRKLSWMQFYPADSPDYVEALIHAIQECASDEDHASRIVSHIQFHDERSPMPSRIMQVAFTTQEQPQGFRPRRRLPDEMPFTRAGIYSVWTKADLERHRAMLNHQQKHTREYAKQALAGWDQYCAKQGYEAFAEESTELQPRIAPARPDVKCQECSDTYWRYVSAAIPGISSFTGKVERCGCAPREVEN